jgi:hypothetical protein
LIGGTGYVVPRLARAAERAAGPIGGIEWVMPRLTGPAEKKAGQARGKAGVRHVGVGEPLVALRGLALEGLAIGRASVLLGNEGAVALEGNGEGVSALALRGKGDGVGG